MERQTTWQVLITMSLQLVCNYETLPLEVSSASTDRSALWDSYVLSESHQTHAKDMQEVAYLKILKRCVSEPCAHTCRETRLLVTLGELDGEVGDERVDVVVPLDLQAEGGGEGQVLWLHCVDVHFLLDTKTGV